MAKKNPTEFVAERLYLWMLEQRYSDGRLRNGWLDKVHIERAKPIPLSRIDSAIGHLRDLDMVESPNGHPDWYHALTAQEIAKRV